MILRESCLTLDELTNYLSLKNGYAWHISDLKIYDKPKELSEFKHWKNYNMGTWVFSNLEEVTKPPQSYMFVESLGE